MEYSNRENKNSFRPYGSSFANGMGGYSRSQKNRLSDITIRKKIQAKKKRKNLFIRIGIGVLIVVLLAIITYAAVVFLRYRKEKKELASFSTAQMKNDIYVDFSLIGFDDYLAIKGMTKQEVYDKVLGSYKWEMKIFNSNPELEIFEMPKYGKEDTTEDITKYMVEKGGDTLGTSQEVKVENPLSDITIEAEKNIYYFPDFVDGQLKKFIDEIYDGYLHSSGIEFGKKNIDTSDPNFTPDFVFSVTDNDAFLDDCLSQLARLWDTKAVRGQIEGYDRLKNEFIFGEDHKGFVIDQTELRKRILDMVNKGNMTSELWTVLKTMDAAGPSVKSRYRYSSIYETWTTDNEIRNQNINLACRAINGTILKPGQEFSFNRVVGQRTEEKGYGYAPAYLEGQVIDELGGGVCQVSTTLYNAVFGAGLLTTYRKSHTFEPSYITPGLDATVSYNGPDYRFINNSDYSIGIKASYNKQKVKIEIFSVPLVPNGETWSLTAKKIQDLDYPTLSIITEGHASKGSQGSEWQVFKLVKEGDKVISRDHDHYAKYQGHTPTAFEEYTYVDDDGNLQTSKFVETQSSTATKKNSENMNIITRENGSTIQVVAPEGE